MSKGKKIVLGILYWIWQLTWGALMTIPGLIIALVLIISGHRVYKNGFSFVVMVGEGWGGLALGAVTLLCEQDDLTTYSYQHLRSHEFGHGVQQLLLGPLHPFVVEIPSAIRYWYFRLTPNKPHKDYDDIWFEYTASKWGTAWINKIEGLSIPYTYTRPKK